MPSYMGGEEDVFLAVEDGPYRPRPIFIDGNGRFCSDVHVDVDRSGRWVRVYLDLKPPWIGEDRARPDGTGSEFLFHALGQTAKQEVFPFTVVAYVDLATRARLFDESEVQVPHPVLRGLTASMPGTEVVHGHALVWLPMRQESTP